MKNKPIAIIGGMGPEASAYLYTTLINNSVKHFQAVNNEDFPQIVLYSVPVPDFISTSAKEQEAVEILKQKVLDINKLNVLCGAIACNTAHKVLSSLQSVADFPFVSMVNEVVTVVKNDNIRQVGLLDTPSTIRSSIYQDAFSKEGIKTLVPSESNFANIEKAIRNVISESTTKDDRQALKETADYLKKGGAEAIVLGCTELPLIFPQEYSLPVYNSVEILSLALLRKYYQSIEKL
jgi:aspartate racemase